VPHLQAHAGKSQADESHAGPGPSGSGRLAVGSAIAAGSRRLGAAAPEYLPTSAAQRPPGLAGDSGRDPQPNRHVPGAPATGPLPPASPPSPPRRPPPADQQGSSPLDHASRPSAARTTPHPQDGNDP